PRKKTPESSSDPSTSLLDDTLLIFLVLRADDAELLKDVPIEVQSSKLMAEAVDGNLPLARDNRVRRKREQSRVR
ncbi:MAG: hypothetical protein ACREII_00935, partial [Nitrospiraceae bacterium]